MSKLVPLEEVNLVLDDYYSTRTKDEIKYKISHIEWQYDIYDIRNPIMWVTQALWVSIWTLIVALIYFTIK